MADTERVELIESLGNSLIASVTRMVIGCYHHIDATLKAVCCQFLRRGEGRIACIGLAPKGHLQVGHHKVMRSESWSYALEDWAIVIATRLLVISRVDLRGMPHNVAHKK